MYKYLILFYCCFLQSFYANATAQTPDFLLYEGDTLMLFSNPLEPFLQNLSEATANDFRNVTHTGCWRGYIAWWRLENDSLFLERVGACWAEDEDEEVVLWDDLSTYFKAYQIAGTGRIFASWVTADLKQPHGKLLHYQHSGYASLYEYQRTFRINGGELLSVENKQYSLPFIAEKLQKGASLQENLHKFIRWEQINQLDWGTAKKRVFVRIRTDEKGHLAELEVLRSGHPKASKEAKRVVRQWFRSHGTIPKGNYYPMAYVIPIVFIPPQ